MSDEEKGSDENQTIFGKILRGELDATIVHEDDDCVAFEDINPAAPTHVLVIPRKHIATLNDLTEADERLVGHMVRVATKIARDRGIAEEGYRLAINCNMMGGQTVYHLHMHLLGGRHMGWPPG